MTVMYSLCSRILLTRVAVQLPLAEAGDRLPGLVLGRADVVVLITSGAADRRKNLKILRDPECYFGRRALPAADTPELEADVRVLFPGEQNRSRLHQWVLPGQTVQGQWQIAEPDGAFQFLAIPGLSPGSPLLRVTVGNQPPPRRDSAPWFAADGFDVRSAQALVETGVRRVWLTEGGTVEELEQIDEILRWAWGEDPAYEDYLDSAVRA